MERSKHNYWRWARGFFAMLLAYFFVGMAYNGAGRIVPDHSTTPPTTHIVDQFRQTLPAVGIALVALACICVGIWKRRSFERVGWVILLGFIFAGMIFS